MIMCPNIDTFGPLVTAAFARAQEASGNFGDDVDPPRIRVRLADRSIRQTNPLLAVPRGVGTGRGRAAASESTSPPWRR